MQIGPASTTPEVLHEIGRRLTRIRLQQNQTLDQVATAAGVGEKTVRRAESGINTSLESLVKILRALGRLDDLESFLPEPLVSPLELISHRLRVRMRMRERQRAYAPRKPRGE